MRRVVLILLGFAALAALIAASASGEGDGGGDYQIRAYFDNAGFLVHGEDVRIAGATVGTVSDVTVSLPGEAVKANGDEDPGKAAVTLSISDPGFQEDIAALLFHEQAPASERDPILLVGHHPLLPHRPRAVPEHGPAVQTLGVSVTAGLHGQTSALDWHFTGATVTVDPFGAVAFAGMDVPHSA